MPPLDATLRDLGADPDYAHLPDGLIVVQVGDLVHKGPDSDAIVDLVQRMMNNNPGRWFQLIGNHEAQYLGGPTFWPHTRLHQSTVATLIRWYREGSLLAAVAVDSQEHGPVLVTHAGLTRPIWQQLGSPPAAAEAARAINEWMREDRHACFDSGAMLAEEGENPRGPLRPRPERAGPCWAHSGSEVYASWLGHGVPFSQAHGHCSLVLWDQMNWGPGIPEEVKRAARFNVDARHSLVPFDGGQFLCMDAAFERRRPTAPLVPLFLTSTAAAPVSF